MITQKEFNEALTKYNNGTPEPIQETVSVLSYEVGRLMEQVMYMSWAKRLHNDDKASVMHLGFAKSEIIDVIAMAVLICEKLGMDFDEAKELGIEKAMERFTRKEVKL